MTRARRQELPLFAWTEQLTLLQLQVERDELLRRIALMRTKSHRRLKLQAQLRDITMRQLQLHRAIRRMS